MSNNKHIKYKLSLLLYADWGSINKGTLQYNVVKWSETENNKEEQTKALNWSRRKLLINALAVKRIASDSWMYKAKTTDKDT